MVASVPSGLWLKNDRFSKMVNLQQGVQNAECCHLCQVIIALGIFNVWIVRYGKETSWRGGDAINMQEEFSAY
jgi:hypothetical protein